MAIEDSGKRNNIRSAKMLKLPQYFFTEPILVERAIESKTLDYVKVGDRVILDSNHDFMPLISINKVRGQAVFNPHGRFDYGSTYALPISEVKILFKPSGVYIENPKLEDFEKWDLILSDLRNIYTIKEIDYKTKMLAVPRDAEERSICHTSLDLVVVLKQKRALIPERWLRQSSIIE